MDAEKKVAILSSWLREVERKLTAHEKSLYKRGKQIRLYRDSKVKCKEQEYKEFLGCLFEWNETHRGEAMGFGGEMLRMIALLDD